RDAGAVVGELRGVGAEPAHLGQPPAHGEPGRPALHDQQADAARARAARAHARRGRAAVVTKWARVPLVMNVLAPSTTYSSPSRTARVRSAATSEPASGAVTPRDPMSSPARAG